MLTPKSRSRCFGGWVEFHEQPSRFCKVPMRFSVFLPPQAENKRVPVLYWLSGLTCSEENFTVKAGAQRYASEHGIALVAPDTSPRNTGIENEAADCEVGTGAGFYVNATSARWRSHFQMFSFVTEELREWIHAHFPVDPQRESISGHSMGGHGALMISLRQPGRFRSVSAFAPISAPTLCPWGQKAFTQLLGENVSEWEAYDTHLLVAKARVRTPFLVDQGGEDKFLSDQLMPQTLKEACLKADYPLMLRVQPGYDHSYYFVSSFIGEHIAYHAQALYGLA